MVDKVQLSFVPCFDPVPFEGDIKMSSPFGPVPPNIDLTEDRAQESNATVIALYVLAFVAVGLRFLARMKAQSVKVGADDYMIVAALVWYSSTSQVMLFSVFFLLTQATTGIRNRTIRMHNLG